MSKNVAQAIERRSSTLFEKLTSNQELAGIFMALLARLVVMAHQLGKPLEGIAIAPPTWTGRRLCAQITFNSLSIPAAQLWGNQPDIFKYAASKANHLANALQKNPGLAKFFTDLVNSVGQFSEHKRIKFHEIKFEKAVITPTNVLMVIVAKDLVGVWDR